MTIETQDAALAASIEFAGHAVADLDRRLGQIDSAVEEAAKRGRTNAAAPLTINDGPYCLFTNVTNNCREQSTTSWR
jgi:hypothetical protein